MNPQQLRLAADILERGLEWEYTGPFLSTWYSGAGSIIKALEGHEIRLKGDLIPSDPNVESLCALLQSRSAAGVKKYGCTTERTDLLTVDWCQNLLEELCDASVYLQRIISDLKKPPTQPEMSEEEMNQAIGGVKAADQRQVFRLRTNYWHSPQAGLVIQRSLKRLVRQSIGFAFLEEEVSMIGADLAARMLTNLNECPDGVYELVLCNQSTDWETGHLDGYDFKLIPFTPPAP